MFGLLINKEKIFVYEWVAMALCLLGVSGIALSKTDDSEGKKNEDNAMFLLGIFMSLMAALLFAMANIATR